MRSDFLHHDHLFAIFLGSLGVIMGDFDGSFSGVLSNMFGDYVANRVILASFFIVPNKYALDLNHFGVFHAFLNMQIQGVEHIKLYHRVENWVNYLIAFLLWLLIPLGF